MRPQLGTRGAGTAIRAGTHSPRESPGAALRGIAQRSAQPSPAGAEVPGSRFLGCLPRRHRVIVSAAGTRPLGVGLECRPTRLRARGDPADVAGAPLRRLIRTMNISNATRPTYVGIGAQKCASTWLHSILAEHPEVAVPEVKEVDFFSYRYDYGYQWYERCFRSSKPARARGEISPSYF